MSVSRWSKGAKLAAVAGEAARTAHQLGVPVLAGGVSAQREAVESLTDVCPAELGSYKRSFAQGL